MPLEFIIGFVVKSLDGYGISEATIRRIIKKSKYDMEDELEESTSQTGNSFGNDDNNPSGQSTV
jgi:hypothetical protein